MKCLNDLIRVSFFNLGFCIGQYTKTFIVLPVIITLVLGAGVLRLKYTNEIEHLFSVTNGESKQELKILDKYFPVNTTSKFSPFRINNPGRYTRVIIQRKDKKSILDKETWKEIMEFDIFLQNISIEWNDDNLNYSELCATWNGKCFTNEHLGLGLIVDKIANGSIRLSYPIMFNPVDFGTYSLNLVFGGFKFVGNEMNTVESINLISLDYFVRVDTEEDKSKGLQWEMKVVDKLKLSQQQWKTIKVDFVTQASIGVELEKNSFSPIPYFSISYCVMMIFVASSAFTGNWVTSKSFVAMAGVGSASLGAVAAVGVLCLIGVPFIALNAAIPFIALGVGVDDTFVMLASWWKTSPSDSVSQRMGICYSESAVSITITTLTDMLSFYVGILSAVPSIQIFCAYAGTTVLFIYIWHILFFGSILALSGHFEKGNRHSVLLWKKIEPEKVVVTVENQDPGKNKSSVKQNAMMEFFKYSFTAFLKKKVTKIFIILLYAVYLGVSFWGITQMKEGLELSKLALSDSYMSSYFREFDKYFRGYPYRSQVIISTPMDYSNIETQELVLGYLKNYTQLESTTSEYEDNWLSDFLRYVDNYKDLYDFNITNSQEFIDTLRTYYLTDSSVQSTDIKFDENYTQILATRYIVQHVNLPDANSEKNLLIARRKFIDSEKSMTVTSFHPFNSLVEISVILKSMTIMLVGIAAIIVTLIALLLIPHPISSLYVFLSIASVEIGVLGFMVLWNINLDTISVSTLIMCIGFSVDFPAHVTYAYVTSKCKTVDEKVQDTMHSLGWPIIQGAISTIIAVSGLLFVDSYVFSVFLKVVILVMLFSVFIALFVLPVILLLLKPNLVQMCGSKIKEHQ